MFKLIFSMFVCAHAMTYASDSNGQIIEVDNEVEKLVNADWLRLKKNFYKEKRKNFFLKKAIMKRKNDEEKEEIYEVKNTWLLGSEGVAPQYDGDEVSAYYNKWAIFEISYCEENSQENKKFLLYCSDVGSVRVQGGAVDFFVGMFSNSGIKNFKLILRPPIYRVDSFSFMFSDCYNLNEVCLGKIKTEPDVSMDYIFKNCYELKKVVFCPSSKLFKKSLLFKKSFFDSCFGLEFIETNSSIFSKECIKFFEKLQSLKIIKIWDPRGKSKKYFTPSWFFSKFKICEEKDGWFSYTPNEKSFLNFCPC